MQGHAAGNHQMRVRSLHVVVNDIAKQPGNQGLIPHQGLVVALRITDGPLFCPPIGQFMPKTLQRPVLVGCVFGEPDPVVRNTHGKAVVKTDAPRLRRCGQARQAADILCNGYRSGVQFVDHAVGQGQVHQGLLIHPAVKIVVIGCKRLFEAMVLVEHTGHPVKTEPVYAVFVHPIAAVGEQEVEHLWPGIVETPRIPGRVPPPRTVVKILVGCPVEVTEALDHVGHGVGMDQVHQHPQPETVGRVDQFLEFFRCAETGRSREKTGHLVSERSVVGVFRQGHQLQGVVAGRGNAWQHLPGKFLVGAHFFSRLGHAHVGLVDQYRRSGRSARPVAPGVGFGWRPDLGGENPRGRILHHPVCISRHPVPLVVGPPQVQPVVHTVPQAVTRQTYLPVPVGVDPLERKGLAHLPVGHIADQENGRGIGRPFAENPLSTPAMQSVIGVSCGQFSQGRCPAGQKTGSHAFNGLQPLPDRVPVRRQVSISGHQAVSFLFNVSGVCRHRFCLCLYRDLPPV